MTKTEIIEVEGIGPARILAHAQEIWQAWYVGRDGRWELWEYFYEEPEASAWAEEHGGHTRIFHISLPEVTA